MVRYLLDTNICIAWLKGEPQVKEKLASLSSEDIGISTINKSLEKYGELKTLPRKQGNIIDEFDLLIAGICLANGLPLVSNNGKHFSRIEGLTLENWLVP